MRIYKEYLIFIILYIISLIFIILKLQIDIDVSGTDPIVIYKYYQYLEDGGSNFLEYTNYYGNNYEFFLPLLTYFLYYLCPNLNIKYYYFILLNIYFILLIFSIRKFLQIKNVKVNEIYIFLIGLVFLVTFPYGTLIQLYRQSLAIALFVFGVTQRSKFISIIFLSLSIITHNSILAYLPLIILFKNSYFYRNNIFVLFLYFISPLALILIFNLDHPSIINNLFGIIYWDIRDVIYFILFILLAVKNFNYKLKFLMFGYFLSILLYTYMGFLGFFQRIFLINFLILNPLIIIYLYTNLIKIKYEDINNYRKL